MSQPTLKKDAFVAALTRQWQRFGLDAAEQMTQHQWWQAVSAALAEQLAAQPAPRTRSSKTLRHVNYYREVNHLILWEEKGFYGNSWEILELPILGI